MLIKPTIFNMQISRQNRRGVIDALHFGIARNYCFGVQPAAKLDTASATKNETKCAELAASYKTAKNRKAEIETKTADKQSLDIEEAIFSWPSMLAKRIDEISDANAASKKMRDLKKEKKQNCEGSRLMKIV